MMQLEENISEDREKNAGVDSVMTMKSEETVIKDEGKKEDNSSMVSPYFSLGDNKCWYLVEFLSLTQHDQQIALLLDVLKCDKSEVRSIYCFYDVCEFYAYMTEEEANRFAELEDVCFVGPSLPLPIKQEQKMSWRKIYARPKIKKHKLSSIGSKLSEQRKNKEKLIYNEALELKRKEELEEESEDYYSNDSSDCSEIYCLYDEFGKRWYIVSLVHDKRPEEQQGLMLAALNWEHVHKESIWNSVNPYGDEDLLVQQSMFRFQKFIIKEQIKEKLERTYNISDADKASPVIAIIDTGINVNHECFHDGDIPAFINEGKWKGGNIKVPYKRKILASRNYTPAIKVNITSNLYDYNFGEDLNGHGTACASIAAGASVALDCLANINGIPSKLVQGANPYARIASYKVRGNKVRLDDDEFVKLQKASLLGAIKQAIVDKVDVISVSLSTTVNARKAYFFDVLNYGAYLAIKENIVLCTSAGNCGDHRLYSLSGSLAPWVVTVGSCNSGGRFITNVELGNASKLKGFDSFIDEDGHDYELIHCAECFKEEKNAKKGKETKDCGKERDPKGKGKITEEEIQPPKKEINTEMVENKVILCDGQPKCSANQFLKEKAAGVLIISYDEEFRSYGLQKPIVYVNKIDGSQIYNYIESCRLSNKKPTAKILKSTYEDNEKIYMLSKQSSIGPNPYDPYILKPDICAPGENILCGSKWNQENMYADYIIMSGTSMANAVVAGMISYIRSIHSKWEPGRIKSAIMTTAIPMQDEKINDVLGFGAGCINPLKAVDPGLVYDLTWEEFRRYMLSRKVDKGYLSSVGENVSGEVIFGRNLNLPSFTLILGSGTSHSFNRVLTNVGPSSKCTYKAKIVRGFKCPSYIQIDVEPPILEFNGIGDKKHFTLTIGSSSVAAEMLVAYARLIWIEQCQEPHTVCSPIVVRHPKLRRKMKKEEYSSMLRKKRLVEQVHDRASKQKVLKLG